MKRIEAFGCPMDSVTLTETVEYIVAAVSRGEFLQHVVVNVAKIVSMQKDRKLYTSVTNCDLINIDGMGVVWGARLLGCSVPERVAGIDLFNSLVFESAKREFPIFLLGAKQSVVGEAARRLKNRHPNLIIAGINHGYFWGNEAEVVEKIRSSGAKLLFVAITSPMKENFIDRWKNELGVDFVMGVGGTFDVVSGCVKRAPIWMQSAGLEWFYRVLQEPKRMWRRYLVTNTQFLALLLCALSFKYLKVPFSRNT